MNIIGNQVLQQMKRLAADGPKAVEAVILDGDQAGYLIGVEGANGVSATLNIADYDKYSVVLRSLQVAVAKTTLSDEELQDRAQQIAEALSYLDEPLKLIEIDGEMKVAQVRSNPPQTDEDEITYWQALVKADPQVAIELARYRWTPDNQEMILYPSTFNLIGRIAEDLAMGLTAR